MKCLTIIFMVKFHFVEQGMDMCTYGENAVKEFFKKQELERNIKAARKANCSVNKKNTIVIRIQLWGIYNINIF